MQMENSMTGNLRWIIHWYPGIVKRREKNIDINGIKKHHHVTGVLYKWVFSHFAVYIILPISATTEQRTSNSLRYFHRICLKCHGCKWNEKNTTAWVETNIDCRRGLDIGYW